MAYDRGESERTEIVSFSHAFHGRTMGALALTPKEQYQAPFRPLMPTRELAEFNDLDSAAAIISDKDGRRFH